MENYLQKFSSNVYLLSLLMLKEGIEVLYAIFSDLTLRDLFTYNNVSSTISIIILVLMFRNIFKADKQIGENYLLNKFNEIRSIKENARNMSGLPTYIQDLYLQMTFVFSEMKKDVEISKSMGDDSLKEFIKDKYKYYYKIANFQPFNDSFRETISNPLL